MSGIRHIPLEKTSWKVLLEDSTSLDPNTTDDIFLIHEFLGAKYRSYQHDLEDWVRGVVRSADNPTNAFVFCFDGLSIRKEGRDALEVGALTLRTMLSTTNQLELSRNKNTNTPDLESSEAALIEPEPRPNLGLQIHRKTVYLIACSDLGSYLVKDILAHPISRTILSLYERIQVIFVHVSKEEGPDHSGLRYWNARQTPFNANYSKRYSDIPQELQTHLTKIDQNFNFVAGTHNSADGNQSPSTIKVLQMTHWTLSELDWSRNLPQAINEVHTIQGLSERSTPRLTPADVLDTSKPPMHSTRVWVDRRLSPVSPTMSLDGRNELIKPPSAADPPGGTSPTESTQAGDITASDNPIQSACEEANYLLQVGDLQNARLLYKQILAHPSLKTRVLEKIDIRTQIAAVELYLGSYEASKQCFLSIKQELDEMEAAYDHKSRARLQYLCREWLASCRLLAGQWGEAIIEMNSLLNENPDRLHIRLHRDLALAYAYLGQYNEARGHLELAQTRAEKRYGSGRKPTNEAQTMEASIKVAMATIYMLAGNYPEALAASSIALDLMKKATGAKHFKTLAVATLKAWCLAYNGQYTEAETLCLATHKIMAETCGHSRPRTLDAMSCLVYTLKCQGRFAEAVATGKLLDKLSANWVMEDGVMYPQAINSKFLLATALLANGQYMKSKREIDTVVSQAEQVMGTNHPETLRYKSEQARIIFFLGNASKARELAILIFQQQEELYPKFQEINNPYQKNPFHSEHALNQPPGVPHPFLVSTAELMANIVVREHLLESDAVAGMLTILRESYSKMGTQNKVLTSSIDISLATLQRAGASSTDEFLRAAQLFKSAYESRKSYMGKDHLDTLCVLREFILTQCIGLSSGPDPDVKAIEERMEDSLIIMEKLQARLGPFHPETLRSQLWYLTMGMVLNNSGGGKWNEIRREIVKSLSSPQVMNERLVESLAMKRQLVGVFIEAGQPQKIIGLVDDTISKIDEAEAGEVDELLKQPLSDLRMEFLELRQMIHDSDAGVDVGTMALGKQVAIE
ncbi:hypothetical protein O1611_g1283 [Lasiodiplodia mahajangana]|uniref:Uncharacterized protein n=1 Tax=Lasiodiplodia mahajangana TaxID=1108764 RepID=A0ACC2JYF2_9PEZI|nr:hypothetical protein O1611_g1283 [Lasiodiplodia mahajangana]